MKNDVLMIIIPAVFTLLGVCMGHYLNHISSYRLFRKQKRYELRQRSYAKLTSLKNPWTQHYQNHLEAKLLSEFHDYIYMNFTQSSFDLDESKRHYDRALELIPVISKIQEEVFETLATIQVCFDMTQELDQAIHDLYNYQTIDISPYQGVFPDREELKKRMGADMNEVKDLLKKEYKEKVENILTLLRPLLK